MASDVSIIILLLLVFPLSLLAVGAVRNAALRRQLVDRPNERSLHTRPTPRIGGLPTVVFALVAAFVGVLLGDFSALWGFWLLGAIMVALVSVADDLFDLPRSARFAVHAIAAGFFVFGVAGAGDVYLPLLGNSLDLVGLAVLFIWIAGLTNAYNFMDGCDGIAGIQGVVAATGLLLLGDSPQTDLVGYVLILSLLGFLAYNWSPASIFMGDAGSTFLGYSFATLPLLAAFNTPEVGRLIVENALFASFLFVWPFVTDAAFTFLRRLAKGERVFQAHRSHLYQRLVLAGWSHRRVSSLYGSLAILGVVIADLTLRRGVVGECIAFTAVAAMFMCLLVLTRRVEEQRQQASI